VSGLTDAALANAPELSILELLSTMTSINAGMHSRVKRF
jgi:hypothetical protein